MASVPVTISLLYYHRTLDKMPDNFDSDMMKDFVDSLLQHTDNFELVVINNGSTVDESWIKEHADKYYEFKRNEGISNGWNKGIEMASNEHVITIADDTLVNPGWVEAMLECFENKDCGISAPHVEGMPYGEGLQETWGWFPGACFMLTKSVIEKVGYFDWKTYFPANFEDCDYQARVLAYGYKMYTNYAVTVQHRMGATLHVDDLSNKFDELGRRFEKKHGFNGQDYFYRGKDIRTVLDKVDKTVVPIATEEDILKGEYRR